MYLLCIQSYESLKLVNLMYAEDLFSQIWSHIALSFFLAVYRTDSCKIMFSDLTETSNQSIPCMIFRHATVRKSIQLDGFLTRNKLNGCCLHLIKGSIFRTIACVCPYGLIEVNLSKSRWMNFSNLFDEMGLLTTIKLLMLGYVH